MIDGQKQWRRPCAPRFKLQHSTPRPDASCCAARACCSPGPSCRGSRAPRAAIRAFSPSCCAARLDGLAAVAPVGDPDWVQLRGNNALTLDGPKPGLPLDGFFALNPAMPNLHRLYQEGHATIVHAAATPYRERSHFDGQDVLESGLPQLGAVDSRLAQPGAGRARAEPGCDSERPQSVRGRADHAAGRARRRAGAFLDAAAPGPGRATRRCCACSISIGTPIRRFAQGLEEGLGAASIAKARRRLRCQAGCCGAPGQRRHRGGARLFRRGGRRGREIPRRARRPARRRARVRWLGHACPRKGR